MSLTRWRAQSTFLPDGSIPNRPDLGLRYPWREVALHARSRELVRRVDRSRAEIDRALSLDLPGGWRMGLSGGKDSTALAFLAPSGIRGMSVKDDLDYPGERAYLSALSSRTGIPIDVLTPEVSLLDYLRTSRTSLLEDLHGRSAELSATWFYGLLDAYQRREGYGGVMLGLRQAESRGRRLNRAKRGLLYRRASDGLHVAQPLADWSTLDVHAFLWRCDWPVLPVYLCVDPGMDWARLRKSWWVCGGGPAQLDSHYAWLRRWWPDFWRMAVEIDAGVAQVS